MNGEYDPTTVAAAPPRRRRMGRSIFILPSLFTVGNIFCGYFAIISTMRGNYDAAAQAIGIAIVLDMLDGRIARLTNSASDFGLQLDSLADVISFGVAPSVLAFFCATRVWPPFRWASSRGARAYSRSTTGRLRTTSRSARRTYSPRWVYRLSSIS